MQTLPATTHRYGELRITSACAIALVASVLAPSSTWSQNTTRAQLHHGSAVVVSGANEYTIRILCDDGRPELGFTTEPNRVTREATGRSNMVNLGLRPWRDTGDVLITLDGVGQAWMPRPASAGGLLSVQVVLRPTTIMMDGVPTLVNYDMWTRGEIPADGQSISFEANCAMRDPAAPAYRKRGA